MPCTTFGQARATSGRAQVGVTDDFIPHFDKYFRLMVDAKMFYDTADDDCNVDEKDMILLGCNRTKTYGIANNITSVAIEASFAGTARLAASGKRRIACAGFVELQQFHLDGRKQDPASAAVLKPFFKGMTKERSLGVGALAGAGGGGMKRGVSNLFQSFERRQHVLVLVACVPMART